jgi:hypothetical protein
LIADRQKLRSAKKVKLASDDCSGGKNFPRHLTENKACFPAGDITEKYKRQIPNTPPMQILSGL